MPHTYNLLSVTGSIISLISADTLYESFENDEKFFGYENYKDRDPSPLLSLEEWKKRNPVPARDHWLLICYNDYKRDTPLEPIPDSIPNDEKTEPPYTLSPYAHLTFDEWKAETDNLDYKAFLCAYKEDLKTIEVYCEHGEPFDKNDRNYTNHLHTSLGVKIADIEVKGGVYVRPYLTPEQIVLRNNVREQIRNTDGQYRIYNEFNIAKNPELFADGSKGNNYVPKSISINSGGGWDTSQNAPLGLHRTDVRSYGRSIEEAYEVAFPMQRFMASLNGNFIRTYTVTGDKIGVNPYAEYLADPENNTRIERNRKILSFVRRESGPIELLDRNVDWPIVYSVYILSLIHI